MVSKLHYIVVIHTPQSVSLCIKILTSWLHVLVAFQSLCNYILGSMGTCHGTSSYLRAVGVMIMSGVRITVFGDRLIIYPQQRQERKKIWGLPSGAKGLLFFLMFPSWDLGEKCGFLCLNPLNPYEICRIHRFHWWVLGSLAEHTCNDSQCSFVHYQSLWQGGDGDESRGLGWVVGGLGW